MKILYKPLWQRIADRINYLTQVKRVTGETIDLLTKAKDELGPYGIRQRAMDWWNAFAEQGCDGCKRDAHKLRDSFMAATFWPEE